MPGWYTYIELDQVVDPGTGPETITYRYGDQGQPPPPSLLPLGILPILLSADTQPARLAIAQGLGIRERVRLRLANLPDDGDVAGDPPAVDVDYWPLWRARHPYISGRALRIIRGDIEAGTFVERERLHYIARRIQDSRGGSIEIEAEDLTGTLARGQAQYPPATEAVLDADIDEHAIGAIFRPASAAADFPDSGYLRIGDEAIQYALSPGPDSGSGPEYYFLTFSERGALGTEAAEHQAGDSIQPLVVWESATIAQVLYDLLTDGAGIPPAQIDLPAWQAIAAEYIAIGISRVLWDPTEVEDLISDLLRIFPIAVWYDPRSQTWGLRALEEIAYATDAPLLDDRSAILADSLDIAEDPDKAWTRILFLHGLRSIDAKPTEPASYLRARLFVAPDLEAPHQRGRSILRTLPVPWLTAGQRVDADRLGWPLRQIGARDRRTIKLTVSATDHNLGPGDFIRLRTRHLVAPNGQPLTQPMIITSAQRTHHGAHIQIEATDLYSGTNARRWAPDDLATPYDTAPADIRARYGYAADTDTLGTAADPAHTWL